MSAFASFPSGLQTLASVSTGAVILAWSAALVLRRQAAALRQLVWLLALCTPLVALPLEHVSPRLTLPILPRVPGNSASPGSAPDQPPTPERPAAVLLKQPPPAPAPPIVRTRLGLPVSAWFGGWLLGVGFLGLLLFAQHRRLRRVVRNTGAHAPDDLLRRLQATKQLFGCTHRVNLVVGPLTQIPFCHGVWRPTIHFPESWRDWDEERIQMCLAHELAHIIRGDLRMILVGQLACLVCWFNPLVWFAAARMRGEAERAADDRVLGGNVAPATYAAGLVAITEHCLASAAPVPGIAFAMARPHRLRARIAAILDPTLRRRPPGRVTVAGAIVLTLTVLTTALSIRLTAAPGEAIPDREKLDVSTLDLEARDAVWSAVQAAVEASDIQTVSSYLDRGFDANATSADYDPLLFEAVDDHQLDIVKLLLAHGADVNGKTSWGGTPIKRACWRGYREIADTLIRAGATADPLLYATGMGDVAALEARDKRQPVTAKEAKEAVGYAVTSGHVNTLDWLWDKLGPLDDQQKDKLLGDCYESAGRGGQLGILQHLEKLGATPAKFGSRALVYAAGGNHADVVKYLLDEGGSPTAAPPRRENLLRTAAGEGRLEIVRLLLDHGADVNARDAQGETPLSWAAYHGQEQVCLLLLERGANGGIEDDSRRNSAWNAAGGTHCPQALAVMLKHGVKIGGEDKNGLNILDYVMSFSAPYPGKTGSSGKVYSAEEVQEINRRELQVIDLLIGAGVDGNGRPGAKTPLMRALDTGHRAAARALLDHGVDLSVRDEAGNTASFYLLENARDGVVPLDLLETLLTREGNPNVEYHWPGTKPPMAISALEIVLQAAGAPFESAKDLASLREVVRLLIKRGAGFAKVSDAQVQVLLKAAAEGDLPLMQETVRQGTSVNSSDVKGWDALAISVALGYNDAAHWLLANGAAAAGHFGSGWENPLRFAVMRGEADLVDQLLAGGAKPRPAGGTDWISLAVTGKNRRVFDALLKAGADPKGSSAISMTDNGKTYRPPAAFPLYLCIQHGQDAMAGTLLERGADAAPADLEHARTLAYWAVYYARPRILQALLDHGADPLRQDDTGTSALSLARKAHPEMVPMLEAAVTRAQAAEGQGRAALQQKAETLIIPQVEFRATPLTEAIESLRQEAARLCAADPDPDQRGINIFIKRSAPPKPPATVGQGAHGASPAPTAGPAGETITLNLDHRPLLEILRAVAGQVGLQVFVEPYAVSLVPLTEQRERLITAQFVVTPDVLGLTIPTALPGVGEPAPPRPNVRPWLEAKGIAFPPGASAAYLPGSQKLVVRNTPANIERVKALFPASALLKQSAAL